MSAPLNFIESPLGLEPLVDFALNGIDGAAGLYSLTSETNAAVRLFVVDAAVHLPDYSPTLSDEQTENVGLTSADDASVLVIVTPGTEQTTVNLLAPIVVNMVTGRARQFILEDQDWPLKAPLQAAS